MREDDLVGLVGNREQRPTFRTSPNEKISASWQAGESGSWQGRANGKRTASWQQTKRSTPRAASVRPKTCRSKGRKADQLTTRQHNDDPNLFFLFCLKLNHSNLFFSVSLATCTRNLSHQDIDLRLMPQPLRLPPPSGPHPASTGGPVSPSPRRVSLRMPHKTKRKRISTVNKSLKKRL